jgi:signal transduction histidine kinase
VLVPALALAAVGARAVTAEMRASDEAAREQARSIASRLARSVDALVEEYAAPLDVDEKSLLFDYDLKTTASHLEPRGQFVIPIVDSIGGGTTRYAPMRTSLERPPHGHKLGLVRDALARARDLAETPAGFEAAAALLAATTEAIAQEDPVQEGGLRWPLRYDEARYSAAAGNKDAALEAIAGACRFPDMGVQEYGGFRYPETALAFAATLLKGASVPDWFASSYERCARNALLVDDAELDAIASSLGAPLPESCAGARRLGAVVRRIAASTPDGHVATAVLDDRNGRPRISVWRTVRTTVGGQLLGGEIPQSVVDERIGHEVAALAAEPRVQSVRIVGQQGSPAFEGRGTASDKLVVETTRIESLSDGWRAEATVAPDAAVPATAWLLAAAVVVMTGALLWGAVALRRAAERSERLAEERRTFLDHVAHELRTPAAAVQALSDELASGHVAAEREPEYRRHLLRESRRLASLVDDTLDFARLDAGRLAFKTAPADLRDVVRQAIEESDGAGRVVARLPDAPVVRDVDAAALRRAVKNLVENAVRHGGGEAPVAVALETSNGHASVVVADKGKGIAAEHLPRIFERFFRVPSATHETKGVGLGLALCREIARAHGGDVEVKSVVGKGSTFTLRVPLS